MKNLFRLYAFMLLCSCDAISVHPTPCEPEIERNLTPVRVYYHWPDSAQNIPPTMKIHLFPDNGEDTYRVNCSSNGDIVFVPTGVDYRPVSYDYDNRTTFTFDDLNSWEGFRVSSNPVNIPGQSAGPIVAAPQPGEFYVARNADLLTLPNHTDTVELHFYPENVLKTFTFLIYNVRGATKIADGRGFLSQMAYIYYVATDRKDPAPATVRFTDIELSGSPRPPFGANCLTGRIDTFGPVGDDAILLSLQLMARNGEIVSADWGDDGEVLRQIRGALGEQGTWEEQQAWRRQNGGFDIVLDNDDKLVIPDGGGGTGAFNPDTDNWDNVDVPLSVQ